MVTTTTLLHDLFVLISNNRDIGELRHQHLSIARQIAAENAGYSADSNENNSGWPPKPLGLHGWKPPSAYQYPTSSIRKNQMTWDASNVVIREFSDLSIFQANCLLLLGTISVSFSLAGNSTLIYTIPHSVIATADDNEPQGQGCQRHLDD